MRLVLTGTRAITLGAMANVGTVRVFVIATPSAALAWLGVHAEQMEVFYLPSYSPSKPERVRAYFGDPRVKYAA